MRVYRLDDHESLSWHGTLRDARDDGNRVPPALRAVVRIHEVHIRADKQGVLRMLKNHQPVIERVGREWRLGDRSGLRPM